MSENIIDNVAALEAVIGKTPPAIALKVIDHLDVGALHWLSVSPLMFATFSKGENIAITLGGGAQGFAVGERNTLRIPLDVLEDLNFAKPGLGFGSLFMAPGIGETLRINGCVSGIEGDHTVIGVEECYVHCAKALIRSDFWNAKPIDKTPESPDAFAEASRFMALATVDADGSADLSPKGDPAGCLARIEHETLLFADRPGNKRMDSFRNILAQPRIAAALLVPGTDWVLIVEGKASLSTDEAARTAFAVTDKVPKLVTKVGSFAMTLRASPALARARLWPVEAKAQGIDPAGLFKAHLKANRDKGFGARVASTIVSLPGLMEKGLEKDYKSNLY